jgi:xanthosine utilization system XapX-like protein
MFKDRSAMDIVVLIWGITVAVTLLLGTIGVLTGKLIHPQMDIVNGAETIATIVAAMVGFIGGRTVGKAEANEANGKSTG